MSDTTTYEPILNNNTHVPTLAECPWCGSPAVYRQTWCRSTHTDDPRFAGQKNLLESLRRMEVIECSNVNCHVLPRLVRIESDDAARLWNYRPASQGPTYNQATIDG